MGSATALASTEPATEAVATEIATENASNDTTSSSATTEISVSTKSPLAFVCLIVISVEAGAVAEASADSTSENAMPSRNMQ